MLNNALLKSILTQVDKPENIRFNLQTILKRFTK